MEHHDSPHEVERTLATVWPPSAWHDVTVLVAVSGGADSVALLRALRAIQADGPGQLIAAHFNHRLRSQESDADEAFVVALCRSLGMGCEVARAQSNPLHDGNDGLEAAARTARYTFLEQTARRVGARYVVTAHTADDQAETILHRILRGTGIAGLAGMARARPLGPAATLLRPLLSFRREQLVAYLADRGQSFCTDATNADVQFTRNRIRHRLLPELAADYNPEVNEALLRLGRLAGEVQGVVDCLVADLAASAAGVESSALVELRLAPLVGQPIYLIRELLIHVWRARGWPMQSMGFAQWDLLARMVVESPAQSPTPSKWTFAGGIVVEVRAEEVQIRRPDF